MMNKAEAKAIVKNVKETIENELQQEAQNYCDTTINDLIKEFAEKGETHVEVKAVPHHIIGRIERIVRNAGFCVSTNYAVDYMVIGWAN